MGISGDSGTSYSLASGFVFTFNLIVGAGALALPLAFLKAGLMFGSLFLALLCFLGYITITYVIESLSIANAFVKDLDERRPLLEAGTKLASPSGSVNRGEPSFSIDRRLELSEMAELFLGRIGHKLFFVVIIIYLYGDVAIYSTAVPTSLISVTQGWSLGHLHFTAHSVYWLYLTLFLLLLGPLCFFDFQKTRFLQYATMAIRNVSLLAMIIIACMYDFEGHGKLPTNWFSFTGFPDIFGAAIYAFMCHHSLPSIVTPIENKSRVYVMMLIDNVSVLATYLALCWSAVWAFGAASNPTCNPTPGPPCQLQALYTQNFASYDVHPIGVFLVLFPIFTLSSNFPMIVITLRNNLMQLITWKEDVIHPTLRRVLFTFLALLPPLIPSYLRAPLSTLISITGGFAGLGIMFFFPALFVFFARRKLIERWGSHQRNPHRSPFGSVVWVWIIFVWCILTLAGQIFRQVWENIPHPNLSSNLTGY